MYGWYCSEVCDCQNGANCDPNDGQCLCPPGFFGDHVIFFNLMYHNYLLFQCERKCLNGTYGPHCRLKCECGSGFGCDPITGQCNCLLGVHGPKCEYGKELLFIFVFFI